MLSRTRRPVWVEHAVVSICIAGLSILSIGEAGVRLSLKVAHEVREVDDVLESIGRGGKVPKARDMRNSVEWMFVEVVMSENQLLHHGGPKIGQDTARIITFTTP